MSIYDHIAQVYEKWSSGDAAYIDSGKFYSHVLGQMKDGKYLELGIGTGRIAIDALRSAPITIVGIDASTKMLEICQQNYDSAADRIGTLQLQYKDFVALDYNREFDGAIMPFRTIGHLLTDDAAQDLFDKVYASLKPGGWFLLDHYMFNRAWADAHNGVKIQMYRDDLITICDEYRYDFERKMMHCQVYVNDVVYEQFDFRWMDPDQIRSFAQNACFEIMRKMGEFDGSIWNPNSYEQIWFFRKPGRSISPIRLPEFG